MIAFTDRILPTNDIELVDTPLDMGRESRRESWIGLEPSGIRALRGEKDVGSIWWVMLPQVAERLGSPCMNIWALGVREELRQNRIASALISRAMARSFALGARFASVATQLWNAPAHAAYAKMGFRPYTILVGREMQRVGDHGLD